MDKFEETRVGHFMDKLAVKTEPGMTNTRLMLINFDLKPVEPERRQWGSYNFVAFWIADSFNVVS
jgi:NCS1 family nucleobase:cation symporter-1